MSRILAILLTMLAVYVSIILFERKPADAGVEAPSWAPGSRRLVYYETEQTSNGEERVSHIRSVDITGRNIYDIDLKDGINGTEPTWSPRLP